ncbi:lyase family protein [Salinisphaera sp. Q1T1-3]|uniref:lyase family protein n=1 Tax=Salinisphaera sp. Q1T1-3 TaxID=2321229 RepID=UPI000E7152BA|nr:lyase family protein [Salinisphaera sp. Q1T1-3]RJS91097.1 adenylosuccinate lyase family protein [Salinisphaera sp. Q1T1-3]
MYEHLLRDPFASSIARGATRDIDLVAAMCRFESALAAVQERRGVLAPGAAPAITDALRPEAFDLDALARETPDGGNVAVAFVKHAKALLPAEWQASLHVGATSQDVLDSALMLVIRPRLGASLAHLDTALAAGGRQMTAHRGTPMPGRTLTQQALPITAGAKIAQWMHGLLAAGLRLRAVHDAGLFVQFGGPVGAHHGLDNGLDQMGALAAELALACPLLPWHTDRQPVLAIGDALGSVAVAAEKIATDVAWMAQTEVAEAREPAATGSGGSSSMPHKANPVGSTRIRAAARQVHAAVATLHGAGAQPHERAFGEWHAEWAPLLDAVILVEGALETLATLLDGLVLDATAMRRNLAIPAGANLGAPSRALLAPHLDDATAKAAIAAAVKHARETGRAYAEALAEQPAVAACLDVETVLAALDPARYTGSSATQVDHMLTAIARTGMLAPAPTKAEVDANTSAL